jgi:hypothetical protein
MKKTIALLTIAAAALIAVPSTVRAENSDSTNAPVETSPAPAKKHGNQFHGKIVAVDSTAMTVTVGKKTYNVTSATKITKGGNPATLADFAVGDEVTGNFKKDGETLNATTLHDSKKKKKAE